MAAISKLRRYSDVIIVGYNNQPIVRRNNLIRHAVAKVYSYTLNLDENTG